MKTIRPLLTAASLIFAASFACGNPVAIHVDADNPVGDMKPIWAFFGYDEPNYTYSDNGKKLLTELSQLSPVPVVVRTHNLLTSRDGNGEPDLKWGFTNAYTEDANGNPVYDWTIIDLIVDTYVERGMTPLIEIGFMPKDLSTKPEPYQHSWSTKGPFWTGWTQPPDDYDKWAELVYQWVVHSIQRYGQEEVERWLWEVWNEPDIGYWSGTFEEYCKLYDYAVDAVKRACPECTVGGPHTTSPGGKSGFPYLMDFLEHCIRGTNYATGETGSPLDYVGFHAKGSPRLVDGHIRMNMGTQLNDVKTGMEVVSSFPELAGIPIIVGEFDPEGCAACSEEREPQYGYRNGTMFSSYVASSVAKVYELTDGSDANLRGILSWAFTFENQPWFAGFRELATHGVDKPVLNTFRMLGMMSGDRVVVTTDEPVRAVEVIEKGVRERPDINALAARGEDNLTVMIWNYHDDDLPADAAEIELSIDGLPDGRILAHHYRVDREFSNSFEEWKRMGRPQEVSDDEYQQIEKSGQLQLLHAPQWLSSNDGRTTIPFSLPRQGVSFIRLTWDD